MYLLDAPDTSINAFKATWGALGRRPEPDPDIEAEDPDAEAVAATA